MRNVHQTKEAKNPREEVAWTIESSQPLETLAMLICHAEECNGNIDEEEVLNLATAARAAIDSLLSDMERVSWEAQQAVAFETLLVEGNA
jgi:hypothetical protein